MAFTHINALTHCDFRVQIYPDGQSLSESCELNTLQSMLDPGEASKNQLNINTYKNEVSKSFLGEGDRLTVVAFDKSNGTPCAIAMFKKNTYDPSLMEPLPLLQIHRDILQTTRKTIWELSYCIRSVDKKGKCLGDICIATGLEALHNLNLNARRQSTVNVWLQLAGCFKNKSALGLYLSYGFEVVAIYLGSVLMILKGLDNVSIDRAVRLVTQKTEATYLLPVLKERADFRVSSPAHQTPTVPAEESDVAASQSSTITQASGSTDAGGEMSQEMESPAEDDDDSDEEATPTQDRGSEGAGTHAADEETLPKSIRFATGCRTRADFALYVSNLKFRTFIESARCENSLSVRPSISDSTEAAMIANISSMIMHLSDLETYHVFLQNLQIAKQIDVLGRSRNMHCLSVAFDLVNNRGIHLSYNYLRELLTLSWAVYRFPVLKQVDLTWRHALRVIPEVASFLDKEIINDDYLLPSNVRTAQDSRYESAYLRLCLQYPPDERLGDGDGLPSLKITQLHGFFVQDEPCRDESVKKVVGNQYPEELRIFHGAPTTLVEKRSRLLGYDTQEAPREPRRSDCDVDQRYWREGRDFLETQLREIRGPIPIDNAHILADCYGVDLYDRLLIDIRSVFDSQNPPSNIQPSLGRFEIASRALATGYAFPTPRYFYNEELNAAFQTAIRERRGAFGEEAPFVNPLVCRKARYELEKRKQRQRRHAYTE